MALGAESIVNTLIGMDPRTLAEALQEEERKRLAAQTASAASQAQTAGTVYQKAAQAPPSEPGMLEMFVPALLSNIASVIAQQPAYREQAQQRIQQSRAELLKTRADNLLALREVYSQKAEAAKSAGDLEAEATARQKQDQIHQTYEMVARNAEQAGRMELEKQHAASAVSLEQERQRGDIATEQERGRQTRLSQAAEGGALKRGLDEASLRQGLDPNTGLVLRTFYQREANKLRIAARSARGNDQKAAAISGIIENELQRINGESPMDFYLRLRSATHPFDRQRVGGKHVPKPLLTPDEVVQALQTNLTPEEFAQLQRLRKARAGG